MTPSLLRKGLDFVWLALFWGAGLLLVGLLVMVIGQIVVRGMTALSWSFLTESPRGMILGTEGGILPAIKGTLSLIVLSVTAAGIPALVTAVYLTEYSADGPIDRCIYGIVSAMVGLPSILTGLFGYALFVVYCGFGFSLLAGGLTLAIMILPTMVMLMQDALLAVDNSYRTVGLALGVSRFYLLCRVIGPQALPGLCGAVLLAMGYAAGATAPIMVTAAVIMAQGPIEWFRPVMAMPYHLYILFSQHVSQDRAYATALVLLLMLLGIHGAVLLLRQMIQRRSSKQ